MKPSSRTPQTPRERAEACFAVARSTAHAGEKAAAISRGEAICAKHGLDLASFSIPGRRRPMPRVRFRVVTASISGSNGVAAAMERLNQALKEASARTGAEEGESPYDAQRRNFEAATANARARDRARG